VGRDDLLYGVEEDLLDYFDPDNRPESPYILAIFGESGSGKTLFVKCLIESLRNSNDFLPEFD
jgi:DNA helicase HerA-like ATPase